MADNNWRVTGDYYETCNCDYLCPCIYTDMAAEPTHGVCKVAMTFHIQKGHFGDVKLDGVSFVVAGEVDGPMASGDWTVGLIVDESASDAQTDAITQICSGTVGGPMEAMSALVGTFAGVTRAPITIETREMGFVVTAGEYLTHEAEGVPRFHQPAQPFFLENTAHPANSRLALAKGIRSTLKVFGIDWDDKAGGHNGHYAPFDWHPA